MARSSWIAVSIAAAATLAACGEPDLEKSQADPRDAPPGYQSDMPAFADKLSDDDIWAVLSFIQSHWKTKRLLETRAQMLSNTRR